MPQQLTYLDYIAGGCLPGNASPSAEVSDTGKDLTIPMPYSSGSITSRLAYLNPLLCVKNGESDLLTVFDSLGPVSHFVFSAVSNVILPDRLACIPQKSRWHIKISKLLANWILPANLVEPKEKKRRDNTVEAVKLNKQRE